VFRVGAPLSLSEILPIISTMGVEVVDERPYGLAGQPRPSFIYDFGLRYDRPIPAEGSALFQDALRAVWDGLNESDGFNGLVLAAGLTWRQATLLRAYAKYMRQGGTPFAQDSIEDALKGNVEITHLLVNLFEARFDPGRQDAVGGEAIEQIDHRLTSAIDDVPSLDHDRILNSYRTLIRATLRTNFFQIDDAGRTKSYLSFKLRPDAIPELPEPRPAFEIFVYSPRVEGVHLRFGRVARGGLRWSDRRDDYRTEVLGLVKAQMVKNAVIVPVGAKGGFYCKQLPHPHDREAWLAEGIACYKSFISALLDVTDNIVGGEVVPPASVVRYDGDDPYLVVAADKGTAAFSDLANDVAKTYGFWLGDAFASGGSVGYDHKRMGITARGAWEAVKRHFREMGVDCQSEAFTCVGIGDMSGDVFGNGMLLSEHTRLVAAFDHRDIFLDPKPDPAASAEERRRMFALGRSSWQDYDASVISEGGGVFSRSAKSIPITSEVRTALGIEDHVTSMTPSELITSILLADVDLLWNGGIGTYVKSESETDADVGDKANDQIRVDGNQLRAKAVGEGGNLGLTQRGRIEYALNGGLINTDFIDNSAGVNTSDHEVNIKILLDAAIAAGSLTETQRNELLAGTTDEVADLVLRDNYEQNIALAMSAAESARQLQVHLDWIRRLEKSGALDRAVEFLPTKKQGTQRKDAGLGLTVPELSVLMAYTKIALTEELLQSDLPDDPLLQSRLTRYFPERLRATFATSLTDHPLRREIITASVVIDLVNGAGTTYFHRLSEETHASAADLTRANFAAREIFGSQAVIDEINALDSTLVAEVQTRMRAEIRDLVERAARWLVYNRPLPLEMSSTVAALRSSTHTVLSALPALFTGRELEVFLARRDDLVAMGVAPELATRVAASAPAYTVLTIVSLAERSGVDPVEAARIHFTLGERLSLPTVEAHIRSLPRADRWQTMARATLREDLHGVHGQLTAEVIATTSAALSPAARVAAWESADEIGIARVVTGIGEISSSGAAELSGLSVGLRLVRTLVRGDILASDAKG